MTKRQADTLRVTLQRGGFQVTAAGRRVGVDYTRLDLPGVMTFVIQGTTPTNYTVTAFEPGTFTKATR
jgi:hypothetical protein